MQTDRTKSTGENSSSSSNQNVQQNSDRPLAGEDEPVVVDAPSPPSSLVSSNSDQTSTALSQTTASRTVSSATTSLTSQKPIIRQKIVLAAQVRKSDAKKNAENMNRKLNIATSSSTLEDETNSSTSSTGRRYKNSPFGLRNHFITMPDVEQANLNQVQRGQTKSRLQQQQQQQRKINHRPRSVLSEDDDDDGADEEARNRHRAELHKHRDDLSSSTVYESSLNLATGKEPADQWARPRVLTSQPSRLIDPLGINNLPSPPRDHRERFTSHVLPAGDAGLDASQCNSKAAKLKQPGEKSCDEDCYSSSQHPFAQQQLKKIHHQHHGGAHELLAANSDPYLALELKRKNKLLASGSSSWDSTSLLIRFSSIMYATFLVILGCILHVSELRQKSKNSSDHIYTTVVALMGIGWLLFLQSDLQRYKRYASKYILIESIFNDHQQAAARQQQQQHKYAGSRRYNPTTRSTSSSAASLVNADRLSMNTEVIFKKTAYKMYQQQAELARLQRQQSYGNIYSAKGGGGGVNGLSGLASSIATGHYKSPSGADDNAAELQQPCDSQLVPAYKFLHGKMGANFYLKCGMAAFCFGHVIHEGLRFGQQLYFFGSSNAACRDLAALVAHLVTPLYSFYQLFMMFKYSNLVINRHKILARFGLMHIIGTSVTFWFRTILEEAFEDFVHKMDYFRAQKKPSLDVDWLLKSGGRGGADEPAQPPTDKSRSEPARQRASSDDLGPKLLDLLTLSLAPSTLSNSRAPVASNASSKAVAAGANMNLAQSALLALMSSPISATITPQLVRHLPDSYACAQNTLLTTKSMNALPYLYPFTIEYNLLLAATFLSLYFNIGKIGPPGGANCCYRPSSRLLAASRLTPSGSSAALDFGFPPPPPSSSSSSSSILAAKLYGHSLAAPEPKKSARSSQRSASFLGSLHLESDNSSAVHRSHQQLEHEQHVAGAKYHFAEYKSNFVVNADCHSANKGLFCGFFVLLVTLVTIVIFFVTINKPTHVQLGIKINLIQEATLTSLILIVSLVGFKQIVKLNRNPYLSNKVTTDDVLMLIPLPFFFIHSLLAFRAETASLYTSGRVDSTLLAAADGFSANESQQLHSALLLADGAARHQPNGSRFAQPRSQQQLSSILGNLTSGQEHLRRANSSASNQRQPQQIDHFKLLTIVLNLAVMIEVLVQTNFIIDGLRRCSESRYLRFKKPGRELITFGILLNITYWIVATFETKSVEQYKTEIEYYGPLPYMFISHTTLPVMLFYRYHSSVCLAEIWNRAYKPPKKLG